MDYELTDKIPLPPIHSEEKRVRPYPFSRMRVGDSFSVSDPMDAQRARLAAAQRKRNHAPWDYATRAEGGGLRIWRIR